MVPIRIIKPRRRRLSKPENQRHQPLSDGRLLPLAISSVVMAVVTNGRLNTDNGLLNIMLGWLGIGPIPWLIRPDGPWSPLPGQRRRSVPLRHGRPLAAMQGFRRLCTRQPGSMVPGRFAGFVSITVPLIGGIVIRGFVISVIHAFQAFDLVYVLTDSNSGPRRLPLCFGHHAVPARVFVLEFGYASALAWVMFAIFGVDRAAVAVPAL